MTEIPETFRVTPRPDVAALRDLLVQQIEDEVRPLLGEHPRQGGYNCCGCPTYDQIVDHVIRIIRGSVSAP